jgi:hypothetical protein
LPAGVELPSHENKSLTGLQDWASGPGAALPDAGPPDDEAGTSQEESEPAEPSTIPQKDMDALRSFFADEISYGDVRFSLLFQSYYVFLDLSVSGDTVTGNLQGEYSE